MHNAQPGSEQAGSSAAELTEDLGAVSGPSKVGKYQILNELGRGSCGLVYRALDPFVAREVAIKLASNLGMRSAATPQAREEAFFAEARAAGRLQHPNIVLVFDAGSDQGLNYIVMEYVEGQTLGQVARQGMNPERLVQVSIECARALDYAHRADVLHRDIKPDNIMVRSDGVTKLMDFSIAALMRDQIVRPDSILGTPSYMAPEQVAGADIGPATDLYSLGAVMYRVLAGRPPHTAKTRDHLLQQIRTTPPKSLRTLRPELPARLTAIVDRLLAMEPKQRFGSGHELARELLKVYDQGASSLQRTPHEAERSALAVLEFCRDMTTVQIDELLAAGRIRRFTPGEWILQPDKPLSDLFLIVFGEVTVDERLAVRHRQSDVFGALALPGGTTQGLSARAETHGLLLQVSRASLEACSANCRTQVYMACCAQLKYHLSLLSALSGQ